MVYIAFFLCWNWCTNDKYTYTCQAFFFFSFLFFSIFLTSTKLKPGLEVCQDGPVIRVVLQVPMLYLTTFTLNITRVATLRDPHPSEMASECNHLPSSFSLTHPTTYLISRLCQLCSRHCRSFILCLTNCSSNQDAAPVCKPNQSFQRGKRWSRPLTCRQTYLLDIYPWSMPENWHAEPESHWGVGRSLSWSSNIFYRYLLAIATPICAKLCHY